MRVVPFEANLNKAPGWLKSNFSYIESIVKVPIVAENNLAPLISPYSNVEEGLYLSFIVVIYIELVPT